MINVKDLCYSYPCGKAILEQISFEVGENDFVAILGNNGVGKSTLLKCINKILRPRQGKISLKGESLLDMKEIDIAKKVAYVGQDIPDVDMTVHDMVMLGRKPHMRWKFSEKDHQIIHEVMEQMGLVGDIQGAFLSELSGGERQKVIIARALAQKPKLLLLDEPTSSLDIKNQYDVLDLIKKNAQKEKIAVIMAVHDINLAMNYCNKFIFLKKPNIVAYGGLDIIDSRLIYDVYSMKSKIIQVDGKKVIVLNQNQE